MLGVPVKVHGTFFAPGSGNVASKERQRHTLCRLGSRLNVVRNTEKLVSVP